MENDEKLICRICLETSKNGFEILDEPIHNSLSLLLLYLNWSISDEPSVCNTCIDNIKKCVDFKTNCLLKRNSIFIESKDVIPTTPNSPIEMIGADFGIRQKCCFCMESVDDKQFVFLTNEGSNVSELLEKYLPEVISDISATTNSKVCMPCYQTLQNYLAFVSKCLTVEEKIMKYCQVEGTNTKGQVDLSSVVYFVSKDQLQSDHSSFSATEPIGHYELDSEEKINVKSEALTEIGKQEVVYIKNEEIKTEAEDNDFERFGALQNSQGPCSPRMYECELCLYRSPSKQCLISHIVTHKNLSQDTTYKCEACEYQTEHKYRLRAHLLIHKSFSEVQTYKCETCDFTTKYKSSLRAHAVIHKSSSELTFHKCETCGYETKFKGNLRKHMVCHKSPSEVRIFKCEFDETCTYETKYKSSILRHIASHKNMLETMYNCEFCDFNTKNKSELHKHEVTHENISLYKCKLCSFQSKHSSSLQKHKLNHKTASELTLYSCEMCTYQTKHKQALHRHTLTKRHVRIATLRSVEKSEGGN